ncbi:MAG: CHAT domain-containing protein [Chitinophagaceae bacterium]|nr:CHAT domain-containing protein [Chitinophagaceae bacterium]
MLCKKLIPFWLVLLFLSSALHATAQPQTDFDKKTTAIYSTTDSSKMAQLAADMYQLIDKNKSLQTTGNYYILKSIFENRLNNSVMAKRCEEKAQKIINAMVGVQTTAPADTSNPTLAWATYYFPALFKNVDPDNANKAAAFVNRYPALQSFNNYNFIAYAFENHNNFAAAKAYYEKAMELIGDEGKEYHTYLYYTNFLTRSGQYQKADEMIRKMETLANRSDIYNASGYKSEAMSAKVVYYLTIGDYQTYVKVSAANYDYFSKQWHQNNPNPCDPYPGIRYTNLAFGKEMLKEYDAAEKYWKTRDSLNYNWVNCYNTTYPNAHYYPISMYPVFLAKRGKLNLLDKPLSFYRKETEDHYNSYKDFANISVQFAKATQLGFLYSPAYPSLFKSLMSLVEKTKNFRESTQPFSEYAYFAMRDKDFQEAASTYVSLFNLNKQWINDIIFTFGEKAFVTYYNAKLKEGYDNFHSFVKIARKHNEVLFEQLSKQAYNNLLFTKSISLKGTQRRKTAFLKSNDTSIHQLYDQWIEKKQALIHQYLIADEPSAKDTANAMNAILLDSLQKEVTALENSLTRKAVDFKKYLQIVPSDWTSVRDKLSAGEAAIEMIRFQWRDQVYYSDTAFYAAYIIKKNSTYPEVIYLPTPANDLENIYYATYKNNIRFKKEDHTSYNVYWKPIAENLKDIHKIYFSPDGIYHIINLATFKNPESQQYLLDEMEIHYTTSTGDIDQHSSVAIRDAVLIGRPAFTLHDTTKTTSTKPVTRSYVRSFKEENIKDLPGTEVEVKTIQQELESSHIKTTLLIKDGASEDKLYALHSPGILHIATHGYWSNAGEKATEGFRIFNAMANSGLLLSGVVNYYNTHPYPNTYDGVLTAYEAQNLDLTNTSLVVLSACETSLGRLDAGEGVYGLQRAFRAAGAGSIITSLWKVDDNATKDFMIAFYAELIQSKNTTKAFIHAQKTIKEKYKLPYFWGAFVLVGE